MWFFKLGLFRKTSRGESQDAIRIFCYAIRFLVRSCALCACQTPTGHRPGSRAGGMDGGIPQAPGAPPPPPRSRPKRSLKKSPSYLARRRETMAHVGVLRAFQEQRIPIAKVVGLEWEHWSADVASKGQCTMWSGSSTRWNNESPAA